MSRYRPALVVPALAFLLSAVPPTASPVHADTPSPAIAHAVDGSTRVSFPRFGGTIALPPGEHWSLRRMPGSADSELVDTRPRGVLWIVPERLGKSCAAQHAKVPTPTFVPPGYAPTMTVGDDGDLVCADTFAGAMGVLFGTGYPLDDGSRAVLHQALAALLDPDPCPVGALCDPATESDDAPPSRDTDTMQTYPHGGTIPVPGLRATVTLPPGRWEVDTLPGVGYTLTERTAWGLLRVTVMHVDSSCEFDEAKRLDGEELIPLPSFVPPGFEPTMAHFGANDALLCAKTPRGWLVADLSADSRLDRHTRALLHGLLSEILAAGSPR